VKTLRDREINNEQTVSEFMKLMDYIKVQKNRPSYYPKNTDEENLTGS
jgi:hypothetical protein